MFVTIGIFCALLGIFLGRYVSCEVQSTLTPYILYNYPHLLGTNDLSELDFTIQWCVACHKQLLAKVPQDVTKWPCSLAHSAYHVRHESIWSLSLNLNTMNWKRSHNNVRVKCGKILKRALEDLNREGGAFPLEFMEASPLPKKCWAEGWGTSEKIWSLWT